VEDLSTQMATSGSIARLTGRLAAGEEAAFEEFHKQYFDRLYQFLLAVTRGHESEAQEALQQTLLRVIRYARVFESEELFWSWLKAVARSAARDAGRKQQRYSNLLANFARFFQGQPQSSASDEGGLDVALKESLDELDPMDRALIEGKYLDGTTVKDLSAGAGLTEKAVESRLLRARRDLRERILKKLKCS
jgi:RNA polymerase sigma-70 factor (ECF subfamily)